MSELQEYLMIEIKAYFNDDLCKQQTQIYGNGAALTVHAPTAVADALLLQVSGLYRQKAFADAVDNEEAVAFFPWLFGNEEIRLDVDGRYPQMAVSGTIKNFFRTTHWIAQLITLGSNEWRGPIWFKNGNTLSFPYTAVHITATRSIFPSQRGLILTFTGPGVPQRRRTFKFDSPNFHPVDFEFDTVADVQPVTAVHTCDHPNRPASLPCETLTLKKVFQRAGFDVTNSSGGAVPISDAGSDARWSDQEMHDAMQSYWSHFDSQAQWAMWVFFDSLHEVGHSLGSIMFDGIGPNHRQGTAVFHNSFIADPPDGDLNPAAWVQRMRFWTACHEMGHSFNLAHSWQKAYGTPWIPLPNEAEARSFMNYPHNVLGGESAFFADFDYRFSDSELLFMRHAPARFVQMGNADWFDDHGFEQAQTTPNPSLQLQLRLNRERPIYEFMEPITLELKLSNTSRQPCRVDAHVLTNAHGLTVILKKDGKPARQFKPYARACWQPQPQTVAAGQSLYESLFVSAGLNGWDIADPGYYTLQIALHVGHEDILSNPLRLRIAPPGSFDEEFLAQDFFSEDVGRILALNGGRFFQGGNQVLREVIGRLPHKRAALHAAQALGQPLTMPYKRLVPAAPDDVARLRLIIRPAQVEEASQLLSHAFTADPVTAVETFGHIRCHQQMTQFCGWLAQQGAADKAAENMAVLYETMEKRVVNGRKILPAVLTTIQQTRDQYTTQ
jgi:hypothetical protein